MTGCGASVEVSKETGIDISVLRMDEFCDDDWCTPDEYRNFLTKIATMDININTPSDVQTFSNNSCRKSVTIREQNTSFTIDVTGNFRTQYNKDLRRQMFADVTSVSSSMRSSSGRWTQTSYDYLFMDSSRTCGINVVGDLTIASATFRNKTAHVEFYCDSEGGIS